jgi:hypothetical protein
MTELRDARLKKALEHAPDEAGAPAQRVREAIRQHALAQAQAAAVRAAAPATPLARRATDKPSFWRWLLGAGGKPGPSAMPWNAAFATVLVAGFVTLVLHYEDTQGPPELRDSQPARRSQPSAVPAAQETALPAAKDDASGAAVGDRAPAAAPPVQAMQPAPAQRGAVAPSPNIAQQAARKSGPPGAAAVQAERKPLDVAAMPEPPAERAKTAPAPLAAAMAPPPAPATVAPSPAPPPAGVADVGQAAAAAGAKLRQESTASGAGAFGGLTAAQHSRAAMAARNAAAGAEPAAAPAAAPALAKADVDAFPASAVQKRVQPPPQLLVAWQTARLARAGKHWLLSRAQAAELGPLLAQLAGRPARTLPAGLPDYQLELLVENQVLVSLSLTGDVLQWSSPGGAASSRQEASDPAQVERLRALLDTLAQALQPTAR